MLSPGLTDLYAREQQRDIARAVVAARQAAEAEGPRPRRSPMGIFAGLLGRRQTARPAATPTPKPMLRPELPR